ncbi:hypothetical protein SAMN04487974_13023 [Pelagibacterium luteolum]|uniref:Enoyl-(Acyl carrier protein) reductase n=1 Tax=Pelagibacterium luteolum TaxID=440168 RepID=A0A1G8AHQ8_9HYPH|nr:hypothetical protein SAMN04487974_13023 [Pelagibacterium luteolum]
MRRSTGGRGGVIVHGGGSRRGGRGHRLRYDQGHLDTLTVGRASEAGRNGIPVNGVRPGLIETEMEIASGTPSVQDS